MNDSRNRLAVAIVTSLFFMWGFITVLVDSLIPRLREMFEMGYFESGLVQFAFFMAYGLLSIPAGWILSKVGYKRGMVLGLGIMGLGCLLFHPAAGLRVFPLFLVAYFMLAGGMTVLQVAANPYVAALGSEQTASSRLILSQAFNSLGTSLAPIAGAVFILSDSIKSSTQIEALGSEAREGYFAKEASAVQGPFVALALALLTLAIVAAVMKLPRVLDSAPTGGYRRALRQRRLLFGAVGIFVYVGAEVALGSYFTNYFLEMHMAEQIRNSSVMSGISSFVLSVFGLREIDFAATDAKGVVGAFVFFYWGGAMLGRFVGALLTRLTAPAKVLSIFATGALVMIVVSISTTGFVAMWSILAVGLFNSILFPAIFTIAIDGLGDLKPQGSGVLCTAIVGGAFIPPAFGWFADQAGFKVAFVLPMICYAFIFMYGRMRFAPVDPASGQSPLKRSTVATTTTGPAQA